MSLEQMVENYCWLESDFIKLKAENAKLRDLLRRALPYVVSEEIRVMNRNGTSTAHAQFADEIRQAIRPLPSEGGE